MTDGQPCALAILVDTKGSSPQNVGAKAIFRANGDIIGTIGGGCMEAEARKDALQRIRTGRAGVLSLHLDNDFGWDDGLICGGRVSILIDPRPERSAGVYQSAIESARNGQLCSLAVPLDGEKAGEAILINLGDSRGALSDAATQAIEARRTGVVDVEGAGQVYFEPIIPRPTLVIAGAGHIGAALAQVAALCEFEVIVVDDRPGFANADRLPFADQTIVSDLPSFFREYPSSSSTYIAIVTRGHRHDAHVLREVLGKPAAYIGMIGSKRKIVVIYEELLRDGLATPDQLRKVHSPMGLALGDVEVGEIAVSIMAEIIAVRRGTELESIHSMQYLPPVVAK
jgi:xanthine dehydrogenase accessory factor